MFEDKKRYENGMEFSQSTVGHYFIDYVESNTDILFVTFEGLYADQTLEPWQRYPWGAKFLMESGYSVLGIKTTRTCWYRGKDLHEALESAPVQKILNEHKHVYFYGDSMGGYGALTFSSIHPGSTVLCYGPQTCLDPKIAPWDLRYPKYGQKADWSGKFKDAADEIQHAKDIFIIYDPFCEVDYKHVMRLPQDNITHLKAPFLDHEVATYISLMDLMKPAVTHLIDGTLADWFPKAVRLRKQTNVYISNLYYGLALRALRYKNLDRAIQNAEKSLQNNIKNKKALDLARMLIAKKTKGRI